MRLLRALLVVVLALFSLTSSIHAQCNPSYDPNCLGGGDGLGPDVGFNPDGGSYTVASGATQDVPVTIVFSDADGLRQETMQLKRWIAGTAYPISGWTWTPNSNGTFATVQGTLRLSTAGDHILTAEITDRAGAVGSGRATFRLANPNPALPVVSLAPHHDHFRNTGVGAATLTYAMPPYYSMDAPRALSLYYNSQQADPTGTVQLDVDTSAATGVVSVTLQIVDQATNAAVTSEDAWGRDSSGKQRVGAQWSMRDRATGAYMFWADVRAYQADKTTHTKTRVPFRVLVINERWSRYGAGWNFTGFQRIHPSSSGLVVTEGNGIARFFENPGCATNVSCTFRTPAGDFSSLIYDAPSGTYIRTYVDGTKVTFSSAGSMLSIADRFGRTSRFEWMYLPDSPPVWILIKVTDPTSRVIWFEYFDGYIQQINANGRLAVFSYGAGGNLTSISGTPSLTAQYDSRNRVTSYTDARGTYDVAYDERGTVRTVTAPAIIAGGASVRPVTTYQSLQMVTTLASWATHICCNWAAAVPSNAVLTSTTDALGHTSRASIDRYGQPTKVIDISGQTTTTTYDDDGLPLVSTDGHRVVTQSWNNCGQLLSKSVNGSVVYNASYNGIDDGPEYEMSGGSGRWYSYGSRGEVLRSWYGAKDDSFRNGTVYQYDGNYRVISATGPKGEKMEWSYAGNPWLNTSEVRVIREDGQRLVTTISYDGTGRPQTVTNPLNQSTTTTYDTLNRPVKVVDPNQGSTTYGYTGVDLTSVTDPAGKTHRYVFNALGWLTSETFPDGKTRSYQYNADGQLTSATDRRGVSSTVTMKYDASHRMTERTADGATTTFSYPDINTVVMVNGETTETHRLHPEAARLYRMSATLGGPSGTHSYEVERILDRDNGWVIKGVDVKRFQGTSLLRTDSLRFTPDFRPVDTTLSSALAVQDLSGRTTTLGYDAAGRLAKMMFPNGVTQANFFTSDGRLTGTMFSTSTAQSILGASFTYDLFNRLSTRTNGDAKKVVSYGYDALGRVNMYQVAEEQLSTNCNPSYEICDPMWTTTRFGSFSYDAAGNRTDSAGVLEPSSNRYSSFNGWSLQYDAEGNLTRKYRAGYDQRLTWNSLGQLVNVTTNGTNSVSYGYTPSGVRFRRTQNGASTYFIYDHDDLIMEADANGNPLRAYTHLPGIDRPLSVRSGSAGSELSYYYTTEQPGNVTGVLSSSGAIAGQHQYAPFGDGEVANDFPGQPLRFMSRELDFGTGLYYVRARWYDSSLARFISEDPIGLAGGLNTYVYADNDPINRRDPSGLDPECPNCLPTIVVECMQTYDPRCDDVPQWNKPGTDWHNVPFTGGEPIMQRPQIFERGLARTRFDDGQAAARAAEKRMYDHAVRACQAAMVRDGKELGRRILIQGLGVHSAASVGDKLVPNRITTFAWRTWWTGVGAAEGGVALGTGIDVVACYFDPGLNH